MRSACHCNTQKCSRHESVCIDGVITVPENLVSPCYVDDARICVADIHWDPFGRALQIEARAEIIVKYVGLNHQLYALRETCFVSACVNLGFPVAGLQINVSGSASDPHVHLVPSPDQSSPCSPNRMNIAFRAFIIFEMTFTSHCPASPC